MNTIFREGRLYVEVPPDRDTPPRLKPDGRGGWRRVGWAGNFKLASYVWGLRSFAPARSLSVPRTSPTRARAPRPRCHSVARRNGDDSSEDDGGGDGDGGGEPPGPRSHGVCALERRRQP
jgi:hypothetical protein